MEFNLGHIGFNPTGDWSPYQTYKRLDVVFYKGDTFVCVLEHKNQEPNERHSEGQYWYMMTDANQAWEDLKPKVDYTYGKIDNIKTIDVKFNENPNVTLDDVMSIDEENFARFENLTVADELNVDGSINFEGGKIESNSQGLFLNADSNKPVHIYNLYNERIVFDGAGTLSNVDDSYIYCDCELAADYLRTDSALSFDPNEKRIIQNITKDRKAHLEVKNTDGDIILNATHITFKDPNQDYQIDARMYNHLFGFGYNKDTGNQKFIINTDNSVNSMDIQLLGEIHLGDWNGKTEDAQVYLQGNLETWSDKIEIDSNTVDIKPKATEKSKCFISDFEKVEIRTNSDNSIFIGDGIGVVSDKDINLVSSAADVYLEGNTVSSVSEYVGLETYNSAQLNLSADAELKTPKASVKCTDDNFVQINAEDGIELDTSNNIDSAEVNLYPENLDVKYKLYGTNGYNMGLHIDGGNASLYGYDTTNNPNEASSRIAVTYDAGIDMKSSWLYLESSDIDIDTDTIKINNATIETTHIEDGEEYEAIKTKGIEAKTLYLKGEEGVSGGAIVFGDYEENPDEWEDESHYCYIKEANDDELTIKAGDLVLKSNNITFMDSSDGESVSFSISDLKALKALISNNQNKQPLQ